MGVAAGVEEEDEEEEDEEEEGGGGHARVNHKITHRGSGMILGASYA
jgi:hypothetical protein